jgi:hypothetical protein
MVAPLGHALTPCQAAADSSWLGREWFDKINLLCLSKVEAGHYLAVVTSF